MLTGRPFDVIVAAQLDRSVELTKRGLAFVVGFKFCIQFGGAPIGFLSRPKPNHISDRDGLPGLGEVNRVGMELGEADTVRITNAELILTRVSGTIGDLEVGGGNKANNVAYDEIANEIRYVFEGAVSVQYFTRWGIVTARRIAGFRMQLR